MNDFAHRLPIDQIRDGARMDLTADEAECGAIAERLGLLALNRFEAHVTLRREGRTVDCAGRIKAQLSQACIASGEPVSAAIDEAFAIRFVPPPVVDGAEPEIELGEADLDTVIHDGQAIDLGEAVADSLALALDPYPRGPKADEALKTAGVLSEAEAGPFALLAKLKGGSGGE